jgi:hypothetical protein
VLRMLLNVFFATVVMRAMDSTGYTSGVRKKERMSNPRTTPNSFS